MKYLVLLPLLLLGILILNGCTVGNAIQVKNLKDRMTILEQRVDSLSHVVNKISNLPCDSSRAKNK